MPPALKAPTAPPAEVISPAAWSVAEAAFSQDHRAEFVLLRFSRPAPAPRLFPRTRQLLTEGKAAWRAASEDWQAHERLRGQLREAQEQLDAAEEAHDDATAAVRAALAKGENYS